MRFHVKTIIFREILIMEPAYMALIVSSGLPGTALFLALESMKKASNFQDFLLLIILFFVV